MSRKIVERDGRQQYIIDIVRPLLAEKGIEETSMDDIALACDYTRRTLYAYFKSRDEIILAVLVDDNALRWAEQKQALAEVATGIDKIRVWAEVLYDYSKRNPQAIHLNMYWDFRGVDRSKIGDDLWENFERVNNDMAAGLRRIFRLGVNDGSVRSDIKVDQSIGHFLSSLRAVIHRALMPTYWFTQQKPDDFVSKYIELFLRGIRNTEGKHK